MSTLAAIVIGAIAAVVGLNARRWIDAAFEAVEKLWRDA